MSKSLGNLHTLDDLVAKGFEPLTVRYVLISAHYRQPLNFTWDTLHAAQKALQKIAAFDEKIAPWKKDNEEVESAEAPFSRAWEMLMDDLNTPGALGALFTGMREVEAFLADSKSHQHRLHQSASMWRRVLFVLGLEKVRSLMAEEKVSAPPEIVAMAQERLVAKKAKAWVEADRLRAAIEAAGWQVRDTRDGFEVVAK